MAGATVRICTSAATGQPCSPLALIYSDPGLTQALANPISTDGLGNYTFYAAPGRYEIEISGPSITTKQIPNVILPSDPTAPTFTTVTTTSGISAFSLTLAGNLTVQGSAAITGTLTVGGAPIAVGECGQPVDGVAAIQGDRSVAGHHRVHAARADAINPAFIGRTRRERLLPARTALSIGVDNNFKNGCGIFIAGAGPASDACDSRTGSRAESERDRHGGIDDGALQGRGD